MKEFTRSALHEAHYMEKKTVWLLQVFTHDSDHLFNIKTEESNLDYPFALTSFSSSKVPLSTTVSCLYYTEGGI